MSCSTCQPNPSPCYEETLDRYTLQDDTYLFVINCPPGENCFGRQGHYGIDYPAGPTAGQITVICCDGSELGPVDWPANATQAQLNAIVRPLVEECIRRELFCDNCTGPDCPPPPPIGPDTGGPAAPTAPTLYWSPAAQGTATCPSGTVTTYTLPAGRFIGYNFDALVLRANRLANVLAKVHAICFSNLPVQWWEGSAVSWPVLVTGTGVHSSYNWSVSSGSLPTGLSLASGWRPGGSSVITGTPTVNGTYTFTLRAVAPDGCVGSQSYTVCIVGASPDTLPDGQNGTAYSQFLSAPACATPPLSWQVTAGALPDGLTLNEATGEISGTPTVTGVFNFTVTLQTEAS
jgi:hypothetical protein